MAIIKCKMCGGDLELIPGQSVAECEYCGSRQTVPAADNDKKMTLFARANRLRAACEFDKAAGVYESIVADFPEEAEAYWGLVLCKYGIEYVDDPATGKKIPTCHRSSFDSILEDSDFEQALENADVVARKQYREEAKQIEEIRKGIIAVSANEQPYDIFICYKETDENGERTLDSVLAQDIYDALTAKSYRVFFSRITLEDKLGLEYEPYIFAALNSAKIMLAVGTDYEYYNAVWVKNEWSRYLKLMAKDKDKHLIPCFKGIDAYDMPKEFARLQAQDLGKVGAMQDLLRGIEKILPKSQPVTVVQEKVVVHTESAAVEPLLKRAFLFMEDKDWKAADAYCEKVLDIDPENAEAYLGKLMVDLKVCNREQLQSYDSLFDQNPNYQKAIRFSDDAQKEYLTSILAHIKSVKYQKAVKRFNSKKFIAASRMFQEIEDYKDSKQYLEESICKVATTLQLLPISINYQYGYINETGKMVIKPQFDHAQKFGENGLAAVEVDGKWGFINETGKIVIKPQFDNLWNRGENGLVAAKVDGKWGFIDETGEMVIKPQFDDAQKFGENGLATVKVDGKWGFINETGKIVIKPQFDDAIFFTENGLAAVKVDGKVGFINKTGEMVIKPQFDDAQKFGENGLAAVKVDIKWGFINEAGEMVIKPQFDNSSSFGANGLALVKVNGKCGLINEAGEMVIAPCFDAIDWNIKSAEFSFVSKEDIGKRNERLAILKAKAEERKKWDILFSEYQKAVEKEDAEVAAVNKELSVLDAQYSVLSALKTDWSRIEDTEHRIDKNLADAQQEIQSLERERNTLGIFARKRKREINARIATLEENQQSLLQEREKLQKEKKGYGNLSDIERELEHIAEQVGHYQEKLQAFDQMRPSTELRIKLSASEYGKKLLVEYDTLH